LWIRFRSLRRGRRKGSKSQRLWWSSSSRVWFLVLAQKKVPWRQNQDQRGCQNQGEQVWWEEERRSCRPCHCCTSVRYIPYSSRWGRHTWQRILLGFRTLFFLSPQWRLTLLSLCLKIQLSKRAIHQGALLGSGGQSLNTSPPAFIVHSGEM